MESTLKEAESAYREVYQSRYPLMRFLTDLGNPLPAALKGAAEFILNTDLRRALSADTPDREAIHRLLEDSRLWMIQLDTEGLAHVFRQTLENKMAVFAANPEDLALLTEMESLVDLARTLPFPVDIRQIQNSYHRLLKVAPGRCETGEEQKTARDWKAHFFALGDRLSFFINRPS